ncbi:hypothetical protein [Nocardioides humilatus]|uniref:hypothetical protein n=1 Tax=Nocardioides humilatus TaxID=2607660 RepID=UPI00165FF942|nr:hypothetical protein [Nocardioides humilatus]
MTASVTLDLSEGHQEKPNGVRRQMLVLHTVPFGARVNLITSTWPDPEAVRLLREHRHQVRFDVTGTDPARIGAWITALTTDTILEWI